MEFNYCENQKEENAHILYGKQFLFSPNGHVIQLKI